MIQLPLLLNQFWLIFDIFQFIDDSLIDSSKSVLPIGVFF